MSFVLRLWVALLGLSSTSCPAQNRRHQSFKPWGLILMSKMRKQRLRAEGTSLAPQSEMRLVLRASQVLSNFLVTQCSFWD